MLTDTHPSPIDVAWQNVRHHQKTRSSCVQQDAHRYPNTLKLDSIQADFTRHPYDDLLFDLLCQLAEACQLNHAIAALFSGDCVNRSEQRPALHTALRNPIQTDDSEVGREFKKKVMRENERVSQFVSETIQRSSDWSDVVLIGIGGSFAGPRLALDALQDYSVTRFSFYFLTTVDDHLFEDIFARINPKKTLFIVSSKSFSTLETFANLEKCLHRLHALTGEATSVLLHQQCVAITAQPEMASAYGFRSEHIFQLWDSIGGRFSVWSAIGLPIRLALGNEHFDDFLNGAMQVDQHVKLTPFSHNIPVRMALLSVWYHSIMSCTHEAVVPYPHRLRKLIPYLQQLTMESNGKSVTQLGEPLRYGSSSVIFGELGNIGQHAYHQLLHQGQYCIPVDFFVMKPNPDSRASLIQYASCLGQADALFHGEIRKNDPHQHVHGQRPSTIFTLDVLTPQTLGSILALYEHKVFIQATILGLNPFDQWGVELGKKLTKSYLERL